MSFKVVANTDVGIYKRTNEDSLVVKHATYHDSEVLMAVICDGMGGLSKGELASATVVREFIEWFNNELIAELNSIDWSVVGNKWALKLKDLNL